jgi:prepilin-type N-terminal cleavage/methylation domain-containing protein
MKRNAFTMLELVMVIIVMGILAALAIPRLERDLQQEAADNILSAIRWTQHLALLDDKHKFNDPKWERRYWRIYFGTCDGKPFYAIGSDDNMDGSSNARVDSTEAALDPSTGKLMWAHDSSCAGSLTLNDLSPNIFIGKRYGVKSVTPGGACSSNKYVAFDHLGRPHGSGFSNATHPVHAGYLSSTCTLTFDLESGNPFTINIEPETGYAYIDGQDDS